MRNLRKEKRIRKQRLQGTLMILAALFVIVAMTVSVPARPERDPCSPDLKPGLLQRCIESEDCMLDAHQLYRHTEYEEMIARMCD